MSVGIYILLFCSMFAVSTSPLIARYLNHLDPIAIAFWRMMIGSIIMHTFSIFYKGKKTLSKKNSILTVSAGILLGLHFALFYSSISLLPNNIVNATVFGTLAPLFALIIEIYFGRKIKINLVLGLIIVLTGSFIMFISDFSFDSHLMQGNLLAVTCSICFAIVFIISDKVRKEESAVNFSKFLFTYATLILFIISIILDINLFSFSNHDFWYLLFLGVVPTIIGHSVFYYLVKYFSPTVVASIPLGEPFIASIIAYFIFPGQIINAYIVFGGTITIFGLFLITQNQKK